MVRKLMTKTNSNISSLKIRQILLSKLNLLFNANPYGYIKTEPGAVSGGR